jgi:deoxyribonuclease V
VQRRLADRVVRRGRIRSLRLVAGADLAFERSRAVCIAGVVVWDVASRAVVEQQVARAELTFPYVPGLLSFREAPALIAALRRIRCEPDLFMFDGQGLAHPRRFGLACHLGLILDRPSIGVAKSVLLGTRDEPGRRRGSRAPLMDRGERLGDALRTRDRVKPVYVSIGHRISLDAAVDATLACCTRYRLPEPTRLADHLVSRERDNP